MKRLCTVIAAGLILGGCVSDRTGVSHTEVPPPVLQTIQKSAPGKINSILRERQGGIVTYRAKVTSAGKDYDLAVAEDGNLLSKKEN